MKISAGRAVSGCLPRLSGRARAEAAGAPSNLLNENLS